ncbi:MAG TPA: polysaccharide deacetylase family protein [Pseudomonadaceae bacterium]|nr:polysaccharide deacetylase family protein [Pseudomonadaceae bacterium]
MIERILRAFRNKPSADAPEVQRENLSFRIPVLCYHSWTINGPDYETNDHVALEQDLKLLGSRGYEVLPVPDLLAALHGEMPADELVGKKLVCLTFDDGRDFDYHEYLSSAWGAVPSFHNILERSSDWLGQYSSGPRAVSFVIASPEARQILDQTCGNGAGEWQDDWWEKSAADGIMGIANHSWDHVHDTLPTVRQRHNQKGSFLAIDSLEDANAQIAEAQAYINRKTGSRAVPVFCYPYGHVSSYLRDDYLPRYGPGLGLRGAFSTDGDFATGGVNVWSIPRFVCGGHWKGLSGLERLLDDAECDTAPQANQSPC